MAPHVYVGTAGWSLDPQRFPGSRSELSGLERYAEHFDAVEINSTFYRLPRPSTLERWRDSTPAAFRFAVKVPRSITHEAALVATRDEVTQFCALARRLAPKLGPLLVQLPPSLELDVRRAARFFRELRAAEARDVVLEPRHPSWFSPRADALLLEHGLVRAAADPAPCAGAAEPFGPGLAYFRWHGSPRMYFSAYEPERLAAFASEVSDAVRRRGMRASYCMFDNTGLGAAAPNALALRALVREASKTHPGRRSAARARGGTRTSSV